MTVPAAWGVVLGLRRVSCSTRSDSDRCVLFLENEANGPKAGSQKVPVWARPLRVCVRTAELGLAGAMLAVWAKVCEPRSSGSHSLPPVIQEGAWGPGTPRGCCRKMAKLATPVRLGSGDF